MPRVIILGLSALNILHLNAIVERGVNWRQRQRAKTVILLDQGLDAKEVAQHMVMSVRYACAAS